MAAEWPKNWQVVELAEAMEVIIDYRGKTPRKSVSGVPLVTAKIVKNGRIEEPNEFIAEKEYDKWMRRGLPEIGDVLLTTEAPLGEVAQLRDSRIALAQRLITLRGKSGVVDNTFLKYVMQSAFVQNQLQSRSSGTTVLGIKQRELKKIRLPLPTLGEQLSIADILGSLDDKIELNRQMNRTLKAIAMTIFKEWFINHAPIKAKTAGATSFKGMPQDVFDKLPNQFTDTKLGPVPDGWKVVPLSDLVIILGGGTPKRKVAEYWGGDISWFSVRDAPAEQNVWVIDTEENITEAGVENSSAKVMRAGTTIISARGTVGRLALTGIPMAMNQSCYGIQGSNGIGDFFVYFTLHHAVTELQQRTHGSVFDTITRKTFDVLNRIRPQPEILKAFEETVSLYLCLILNNLFENRTLANIRDVLLPKLMSGELRVAGDKEVNRGG